MNAVTCNVVCNGRTMFGLAINLTVSRLNLAKRLEYVDTRELSRCADWLSLRTVAPSRLRTPTINTQLWVRSAQRPNPIDCRPRRPWQDAGLSNKNSHPLPERQPNRRRRKKPATRAASLLLLRPLRTTTERKASQPAVTPPHSTVTAFAKILGHATSRPSATARQYAIS